MIPIETDVVILGGGIQGLWLLAELVDRGYQALVLERNHPGARQTGHAHFFLHQGHMHAYRKDKESDDVAKDRVKTFREAHKIWMAELSSRRLKSVSPLKGRFYIGGTSTERKDGFSSICGLAKLDCNKVQPIPDTFPHCTWMFEAEGVCLEAHAVLNSLLDHKDLRNRIAPCGDVVVDEQGANSFRLSVGPSLSRLNWLGSTLEFEIVCQGLVLNAGAGNEVLIRESFPPTDRIFENSVVRQQTVKTYMLVVKASPSELVPICGLFPDNGGIFIAHRVAPDGDIVWLVADGNRYHVSVPGEWPVLDSGAWFRNLQISLGQVYPSLFKFPSRFQWGIYEATKAESWTASRRYPNGGALPERHRIFKHPRDNLWAAWPTFLTLAPTVALEIAEAVSAKLAPRYAKIDNHNSWNTKLKQPHVAKDQWQTTPLLDWETFSHCYAE